MSKQISFEEIREGDRIQARRVYSQKGIEYDRTSVGVAAYQTGFAWFTADHGQIVAHAHHAQIALLDRPKPPLPTTPGTVFRATEVRGEACDVTAMACHWQGRITYTSSIAVANNVAHNASDITAWEPIENGVAR